MSQKRFKQILLNYPRLIGLLYLIACGIISVNSTKQEDDNKKEHFISSSDLLVSPIDLDDDLKDLNLMPENEARNARAIAISNSVLTYGSGVYTTDTTILNSTALPQQQATQAKPSQDGSSTAMPIVIAMSIGSALSAAGLIAAIIYCIKMVGARKRLIRPLPNGNQQAPAINNGNMNSSNNNSNNKSKSPQSNNSKNNSNNKNKNENKKNDQSRSQSRSLRSKNSAMTDVSV